MSPAGTCSPGAAADLRLEASKATEHLDAPEVVLGQGPLGLVGALVVALQAGHADRDGGHGHSASAAEGFDGPALQRSG